MPTLWIFENWPVTIRWFHHPRNTCLYFCPDRWPAKSGNNSLQTNKGADVMGCYDAKPRQDDHTHQMSCMFCNLGLLLPTDSQITSPKEGSVQSCNYSTQRSDGLKLKKHEKGLIPDAPVCAFACPLRRALRSWRRLLGEHWRAPSEWLSPLLVRLNQFHPVSAKERIPVEIRKIVKPFSKHFT